mmetsp:Transcript_9237/g.33883  ORF Transcript_9237/g.33883 Transcript_9237/m.33883 type:complete len:111 (-) Transcript_9237:264-596(-)
MYNKYNDQGLEILAFPCNQFGGQEPGSDADVKRFAEGYGAKFPIFSKIDVNGPGTHPFYASLKSTAGGGILGNDIKWNFGKFVIDRQGNVKRYAPTSSPLSMEDDIKKLL